MIQLVIATDKNGCIGKKNALPFKLKTDLQNFKHVTLNSVCILGRKTFESLKEPLKNRTMLVCTKAVTGLNLISDKPDIWYTNEPLYWLKSFQKQKDISIIGGAKIYALFAPIVDKIVWTRVDCEIQNGDAFYMPNTDNFALVNEASYEKDNDNEYNFVIQTWEKIAK